MKKYEWQYNGDLNMLDYGGKYMRQTSGRQFQIIELINMNEACGHDNDGQPEYIVELRLVDLAVITPANVQSALKCCGMENQAEMSELILAECCDTYGVHAPLGSWSGNKAGQLLKEARRLANQLLSESTLEKLLEKPVNKIGSTAREYMSGDFTSAITRGCQAGNADARIMAKMHGID